MCFDRLNNFSAIDLGVDGSLLDEKASYKMLGLSFSSKLDWDFYTIFIVKITSKKIGTLIFSMKFFLLKLLFIFITLSYSLANITLVMYGQVLQIARKSIEKRM